MNLWYHHWQWLVRWSEWSWMNLECTHGGDDSVEEEQWAWRWRLGGGSQSYYPRHPYHCDPHHLYRVCLGLMISLLWFYCFYLPVFVCMSWLLFVFNVFVFACNCFGIWQWSVVVLSEQQSHWCAPARPQQPLHGVSLLLLVALFVDCLFAYWCLFVVSTLQQDLHNSRYLQDISPLILVVRIVNIKLEFDLDLLEYSEGL